MAWLEQLLERHELLDEWAGARETRRWEGPVRAVSGVMVLLEMTWLLKKFTKELHCR